MFTKVRRRFIVALLLAAMVCCFGMAFGGKSETKVSAAGVPSFSNTYISAFQFTTNIKVARAVLLVGGHNPTGSIRYAANRPWLVSEISSMATGEPGAKFNDLFESVASISSDGKTLTFANTYTGNEAVAYFSIIASTSANGEAGISYVWSYSGAWTDGGANNCVGKWSSVSGNQVTSNSTAFTLSGKTAIMSMAFNRQSYPAFNVTYNANGGTGGTVYAKATYGYRLNNIVIPTKAGYTFAGYYDTLAATGGNQYINATGVGLKLWDKLATATLYARWTAKQISVTSPAAASATYGAAFAYNFAVANDTGGAISAALKSGAIPAGLTLANGKITGTPTAAYPTGIDAVFTVTGANGTKVDHTVKFTIAKANLGGAVITAVGNQTYTGSAIVPEPKVAFNGIEINKTNDFTYSWTSNINAGTATLTITAKADGNFTGSKSIDFNIVKANQPALSIANKPGSTWVLGNAGNVLQLAVTGGVSSITTSYASSDTTVATVDENGLVTFLKAGAVTITVTKAADSNYNEAADSFTAQVKDNVAIIGDTYYDSIENAFANAVSGDSIELTKDTAVSDEIVIQDRTLTLTGGVNKYTLTVNSSAFLSVKGAGSLTLENIILDGAANWVQGADGLNSNSNATAERGALSVINVSDANGVLNLNNVVIQNVAAANALGIIRSAGTANIDGSIIQNNLAGKGGAIAACGGTVNISDSQLKKNQAQDGGAIYYGANNLGTATVNLVGSVLEDNIVTGDGSAVYTVFGGKLTIDSTTSVNGIIYLGANEDGSEVAKVTVIGGAMNKIVVYADNKAVNYYHDFEQEPKPTIIIVESKDAAISSAELKQNVSVKNAGVTADVTVGNGCLRIMETTEYAAALQVGNKAEWFKSLNAAIKYLEDNSIKTATVFVVDSFNESFAGWVNNKTVTLTEGVAIPRGFNVTLESAKRNVAVDDVTVTLEPIGEDIITLKRANGLVSDMISVESGGILKIKDLIIDGGAVWAGGSAINSVAANSFAAGDISYINGGNSGVFANAPIIKNMGGLTLDSGAVLQNNENKFSVFGSPNYGGGVANLGAASLDMRENSIIQNCYAREGGGVQNINGGRHTDFVDGENSVNISGKILNCVSHTKGAAIETIYGGATTAVGTSADLTGNVSLMNQGVLTVEEGGVLEVKGGTVSAAEGKYAIYTYNKYGKDDIVEVNGNTPYLEGVSAAELKINGAPAINGKIYLDNNCKLASNAEAEFKPFVDMTGYTGSADITIAINAAKGSDSVVAIGAIGKVKTEIDKTDMHKLSDVFEYAFSSAELRLGSYQIDVKQSGLEEFTISGTAYGISEITISGVTINVTDNKFEEKMTLKSVKFPSPHGGEIVYNADGKILVEADNFAKLEVSCIPEGKTEIAKELKFGVLTMDESYNIYAPAGTTYRTEDGREVLRANALLPNDIYIDENGFATFFIEGNGDRETVVEIGVRDITPPGGGKYMDVTDTSITITTEVGSEYVLMNEDGDLVTKWAAGDGQDFTFEGLDPETKYTVIKRKTNTSSAPNKYIIADEVLTLKSGETTESLLAAFLEEYKKVEAKLSPDKFGELEGGALDLAKALEEFEKLSPTMKILVQDKFLLLKQTEKAMELKEVYDGYVKADYLDEDFEDLKDIYIAAVDNLYTKFTDEDRADVFDSAAADMAAISTKEDRITAAKGELSDYLVDGDSQAVKDIIAGGQTATESVTTLEGMNKLVADTKLLADKKRAEQTVNEKFGEIELNGEFDSMTADEKKRITDKRDELLEAFEAATAKGGVDEVIGRLSEIYIEYGKTLVDRLRDDEDSEVVSNILDKAILDIGSETDEAAIDEIVKTAKLDIAKQKVMEEIAAAYEEIKTREDYSKYTEEEKAAIEKVKTDALAEIQTLVDPDGDYATGLDEIIAGAKFDLEYKNAIGEINAIENETDSDEAKKLIDDAIESLIGGIAGGSIVTADDIKEVVDGVKAAVELDREKNKAIDELEAFESAADSDEAKGLISQAIDALNKGVGDGSIATAGDIAKIAEDAKAAVELDRDKNKAIEELNSYIKNNDSDEAKELISQAIDALNKGVGNGSIATAGDIAKIAEDAKAAVELDRDKNKAIDGLNEWFNKLIDSGKYTESGEKELEGIYQKALEEIEEGNSNAEYVAIVEKAKEDLGEINVGAIGNGIVPGGGSNVTPDEYPDYSDEIDEAKDGFIGGISSSGGLGMSSDWSLSIKKTDVSKSVMDALGKIDGKLGVGRMIEVSLTDGSGKVVATPNGTYNVSMLLPKDLRGSGDIKIVSTDASGNTMVLLATRSGDFITFETASLGTFAVLSDKVVDLTWAIVALSALILIELIVIVLMIMRKRKNDESENEDNKKVEDSDKKKSDVKTYSSALPLFLLGAIVYAPASAISIILALAAVALCLGGVIVYLALKGRKSEESEETLEETSEDEQTAEPQIAPVESESALANEQNAEEEQVAAEEIAETVQTEKATDEDEIEAASQEITATVMTEEIIETVETETVIEEVPFEQEETQETVEIVEATVADLEKDTELINEDGETAEESVVSEVSENDSEEIAAADELGETGEDTQEDKDQFGQEGEGAEKQEKAILAEVADNDGEDLDSCLVAEVRDTDESDDEQGGKLKKSSTLVIISGDEDDNGFVARYNKSYTAKMIMSGDDTKEFYTQIKNEMLSYSGVKSRISWKGERFNKGRKTLMKLFVNGKTLHIYYALPHDSVDAGFKTEAAGQSETFAEVPTKISVKRPIHARRATELVSLLMAAENVKQGKRCEANYDELLHIRSMNQLIEDGLVKELMTEEEYNAKKKTAGRGLPRVDKVGAHEVEKMITDDVAVADIIEKIHEIDRSHRAIINIDTLSANFVSGDIVTLDSLKAKQLVPKNTTFYKVLARGYLDKALTVEAQDYSLDAVKMLILTGGQAVKLG